MWNFYHQKYNEKEKLETILIGSLLKNKAELQHLKKMSGC